MNPLPTSSHYCLSQDAKVGKYDVKAGDNFIINMNGLHKNRAEWQRPMEFLPERFDPTDPLSLTPAGKKRHTMSWVPFFGGKRVCFGKTFAEANLKLVSTYLTQYFDFEFVEKEKYPDTNSLPPNQVGQSEYPSIPVRVTKNKSKDF